ncbi:MAG: hypothetical protein QXP36_08835 [Conexivisphaerales archaeon]
MSLTHLLVLSLLVAVSDFIIITIGALLNELNKMGKAAIPRIALSNATPYFLVILFISNYVFNAVVLGLLLSSLLLKSESLSLLIGEEYLSDMVAFFYAFSGLAFLLYIVRVLRRRASIQ